MRSSSWGEFEYGKDCLLLFIDHEERVIEDPEGKRFRFAAEVDPEDFMKYLNYVRTEYIPVE